MFILVKKVDNIVSILDTDDNSIERHSLSKVVDWIKAKKVSRVYGIHVYNNGDSSGDIWIDWDEVRDINKRHHLGLDF